MHSLLSRYITGSQINIFEHRFNSALEMAKMTVWEWYPKTDNFKIMGYNPQIKSQANNIYIPFENYLKHVHPEDRFKIRESLIAVIKQNIDYKLIFRTILPDGKTEWISARGKAYYNQQGVFECVKGVSIVITAFKNASLFVAKYEEELAHMDRLHSMGEMASSLAHELTQPLTVIRTYISACILRLQEIPSPKNQAIIDGMKKAANQVSRMGLIIHNMKNFIRKGITTYEKVSINHLLKEALFFFEHIINSKKISLKIDYDENSSIVLADSIKIQQVLINLVRNAVQAMEQAKTVDPKIHIYTTTYNKSSITVNIKDNGPGIDAAIIDQIFTPYFTTRPDGLGMGLAICQTIIEAHKGRIQAFNSPEGGAIFQFTLPVASHAN